jgi:hypothetical protein
MESCKRSNLRSVLDGGAEYQVRLICSENEGHKAEQHYDDTFNRSWTEGEEEPEVTVNQKNVLAWDWMGMNPGIA